MLAPWPLRLRLAGRLGDGLRGLEIDVHPHPLVGGVDIEAAVHRVIGVEAIGPGRMRRGARRVGLEVRLDGAVGDDRADAEAAAADLLGPGDAALDARDELVEIDILQVVVGLDRRPRRGSRCPRPTGPRPCGWYSLPMLRLPELPNEPVSQFCAAIAAAFAAVAIWPMPKVAVMTTSPEAASYLASPPIRLSA